ncbi:hypothetical protein LWC35_37180 [Pseudonocardia kujensis]|uniref:hypothetical protein n=1 Tax=Pseudonocardia kujensis TaxID=1128675 RepID=UPI001E2C7A93|nr:hypothetical protein [Pseudonocardia kujensis]MCE0768487.1 hypothetical protein [Pseudonocardia kujensis]
MRVLLSTGIRIAELLGVDLGDVTETDGGFLLAIPRKGGRDDEARVPGLAADALRRWISVRRGGSRAVSRRGGSGSPGTPSPTC